MAAIASRRQSLPVADEGKVTEHIVVRGEPAGLDPQHGLEDEAREDTGAGRVRVLTFSRTCAGGGAVNWEAIGAIGEVVGGLAVVVSIVYLSIQIRSNTRTMKAKASFDATHSWASVNELVPQLPQDVHETAIRSYAPDASWEDFSDLQRFNIVLIHRALFQKLEGQFLLHKYGFLEEELWRQRATWAASLINLPFYRQWWAGEKDQLIYTTEFVSAIEAYAAVRLSIAGASPGREPTPVLAA
jgi:hypothetical protein